MAITTYDLIADAQNGRNRLKFGNPVLCTNWVRDMIEKHASCIPDIETGLTINGESSRGINPLSDASITIARLERFLGELERND